MVKEDFLYYLWKTKSFFWTELVLEDGRELHISNWGSQNHDAGPDFSNARIQIFQDDWAGNIEMHVRSSDWYKHGHQLDPAYNSVILHVVWEDDQIVLNEAGKRIPTLSLQHRVSPKVYQQYLKINQIEDQLPCTNALEHIHETRFRIWAERLFVERLEEKTQRVQAALDYNDKDWEETFYHLLSQYLGLTKNMIPFLTLARSTPLKTLLKHSDNPFALEALLYGQAGMLHSQRKDSYPRRLFKEYSFLKHKYNLSEMNTESWKFLRMRPVSFPTIRISQLAQLIHKNAPMARTILESSDVGQLRFLLEVSASEYWQRHYTFDKESKNSPKNLGRSMIDRLIINVIAPFVYSYGINHSIVEYKDKAIQWLQDLPPEKNKISTFWRRHMDYGHNAYQTQALIALDKNFCSAKKCLDCMIGCQIMKNIYTVEDAEQNYRNAHGMYFA